MDEGLREKSWRKVEMELWRNGYGSLVMRGLRENERKREKVIMWNVSQMSLGFIKWKWSLVNDVG